MQRKTKVRTTEIKPIEMTAMKNTTEKAADTDESLEIPVVGRVETGTPKQRPIVHYGFDDQLDRKVSVGDTEASIKIDEISLSSDYNSHRSPCFCDYTTDAMYDQIGPFLRAFLVSQNYQASVVFLKRVCAVDAPYDIYMYRTAAAVYDQCILTAKRNVGKKVQKLWDELLELLYLAEHHAEVLKEGYIILEEFEDQLQGPARVWQAMNQRDSVEMPPPSN